MKKTGLLLCLMALVAFLPLVNAQDTIDTTYHRYNFHRPPRYIDTMVNPPFVLPPMPPVLIDSVTGENVTDPVTGETVLVCPNGLGFTGYEISVVHTIEEQDVVPPAPNYFICKMKQPVNTIYGLSVLLERIENFTVGDSAMFVLAERLPETGRITPFDTVVIQGGEIGIRRKLEVPLMPSNVEELCYSVNNSCIDSVEYAPVKEFYLDTPHQLVGDTLYISPKWRNNYGSRYRVAFLDAKYLIYNATIVVFDEDVYGFYEERWGVFGNPVPYMQYAIPIIEPLPEWEEELLDTIIPMPTKPDNPDPGDPQNPDNPDNPQNPDNPEDPDDPDNPGGDEGIGAVDGGLQSAVSLRPNPSSGVTTVSCAEPISELTVRDMAWRVVLRKAACGSSTTFDTSTLRKGVYLVKVTTARGTTTKKLVVEP